MKGRKKKQACMYKHCDDEQEQTTIFPRNLPNTQ